MWTVNSELIVLQVAETQQPVQYVPPVHLPFAIKPASGAINAAAASRHIYKSFSPHKLAPGFTSSPLCH